MDNLIFDLVTEQGFWGIRPSKFEEKLKSYRDEIDIKINTVEELINYINNWIIEHKFSNLENKVLDFDLEKGYSIREAIYTVEGKYYAIIYYSDPYNDPELEEGPVEVHPITETITVTKYVKI